MFPKIKTKKDKIHIAIFTASSKPFFDYFNLINFMKKKKKMVIEQEFDLHVVIKITECML
jgi:hypothetical protein